MRWHSQLADEIDAEFGELEGLLPWERIELAARPRRKPLTRAERAARIAAYRSSEHGRAKRREHQRKYNHSEKGLATFKRYRQSEKGRAKSLEYERSEKRRAYKREYFQTERGRAVREKYARKRAQLGQARRDYASAGRTQRA